MKNKVLVLAASALALTLSACGGDNSSNLLPQQQASSGSASPTATSSANNSATADTSLPSEDSAVPIPAGQIERALQQLDSLANSTREAFGIPGLAVAVVRGGQTVYAKGFGVRVFGNPTLVDADTVFQLASISKPVTATVVAQQVGQGRISWDTPVHDRLPDFRIGDDYVTANVTVGDLLSHRSGLPDHAGDKLEDLDYGQSDVLNRLRLLPLEPFRNSYAYTNFGFTAGALAVSAAAGTDWASLSEQALFQPLGMQSTSARYTDYLARANRVQGHVKVNGQYQPGDRRDPDAQAPAGGVSSSVNDMARWLRMLLAMGRFDGHPVIPQAALMPAITPQVISSPPPTAGARAGTYGYGFNVGVTSAGRVMLSHSGAFALGAATSFAALPSADIGIIILTNAQPVGAAETISASFMDLVQLGSVSRDWESYFRKNFAGFLQPVGSLVGKSLPTNPAPSRALADLAGSYRNDYYGPVQVEIVNGQLQLRMATGVTYALSHWDGDTFSFGLDTENAPAGSISAVNFGQQDMVIEYFNDQEMGRFVR